MLSKSAGHWEKKKNKTQLINSRVKSEENTWEVKTDAHIWWLSGTKHMNICNLGASFVLFNWKIIKVILCKEEKKATAQKAQRQQTLSYPKVSQNDKNQDSAELRRGTLILTREEKAVCN